MRIPIDRESDIPLYRQIEGFLKHSIVCSALPPETKLPAARRLSEALGVSRITIDNAYAALESDGLIARRAGSGTYVLAPDSPPARHENTGAAWPQWQEQALRSDSFYRLRATFGRPGARAGREPITFDGFGDPRLFPIDDFLRAIKHVVRRDGIDAFAWDDRRGYEPLRAMIATVLANQGLHVQPDNVLITSGSQQALMLVVQLLLKPGDAVLVESPSYGLALDLFRAQHLELVGCPTDAQGMQVAALETLLEQHRPRLIYTIPTFQNPTGTCLGLERRRRLIELAGRYNIPVIEDDFAAELRYDGTAQPALKALDHSGNVIYVGTFSKLLMPGLRVGFLVANGPAFELLTQLKRLNDLLSSTITQRALESYLTVGRYQAHVARLNRIYRSRRDAMLEAIEAFLPPEVTVVPPEGGLYMWVGLPEGIGTTRLLPLAEAEGVAYAPGARMFPEPCHDSPYMRLDFARQPVQQINEGMRSLGRAIKRYLASSAGASPAATTIRRA